MADITKMIISLIIIGTIVVPLTTAISLVGKYDSGEASWEIKKSMGFYGTEATVKQDSYAQIISLQVRRVSSYGCYVSMSIYSKDNNNQIGYLVRNFEKRKINTVGWNNFTVDDPAPLKRDKEYWLVFNTSEENCLEVFTGTYQEGARFVGSMPNPDYILGSSINYKIFSGVTNNYKSITDPLYDYDEKKLCEEKGGELLSINGGMFCVLNDSYIDIEDVNKSAAPLVGASINKDNPLLGQIAIFSIILLIIWGISENRTSNRDRSTKRINYEESIKAERKIFRGDKRRMRPDGGFY